MSVLKVRSRKFYLNTFIYIYRYLSSTVPWYKWQYRGVISMFCICQRNAESMTKQWHTLYGYAVRPEKVSWTSPCRVSSSFSSTISSSLVAHCGTTWSLRCLSLRRSSPFLRRQLQHSGTYDGGLGGIPEVVKDGYVLCQWVFHSVLTFSSLFSKLNGFI